MLSEHGKEKYVIVCGINLQTVFQGLFLDLKQTHEVYTRALGIVSSSFVV